jgi:hypothetical protein
MLGRRQHTRLEWNTLYKTVDNLTSLLFALKNPHNIAGIISLNRYNRQL